MPSHTQDAPAKSESAAPTYTQRDIPVSHLVVSQNNPRKQFDEQELARLAHAMSTRGFDHPILVKPTDQEDYYEIIDGERRWRAAQLAAVETIPALVKTRATVPGDDLLDAMLANGLGISLDVLEEALGYPDAHQRARLHPQGPRRGVPDSPGARARATADPRPAREGPPPGRRRDRPADGLKALASLAKAHVGLPEVAVKRVLDGPVQEWDEPRTWEDLVADPISVVIGDYQEQLADLPDRRVRRRRQLPGRAVRSGREGAKGPARSLRASCRPSRSSSRCSSTSDLLAAGARAERCPPLGQRERGDHRRRGCRQPARRRLHQQMPHGPAQATQRLGARLKGRRALHPRP